jgi:hypothetical protein
MEEAVSDPLKTMDGVPMEIRVRALEARMTEVELAVKKTKGAPADLVASDSELDSAYGNPKVFSDPKRWITDGGESMKDKLYSECPAEFLDVLAGSLDWLANQLEKEGKPNAGYKRKDAARARGWAKRIRAGGVLPSSQHRLPDLDTEFGIDE